MEAGGALELPSQNVKFRHLIVKHQTEQIGDVDRAGGALLIDTRGSTDLWQLRGPTDLIMTAASGGKTSDNYFTLGRIVFKLSPATGSLVSTIEAKPPWYKGGNEITRFCIHFS